MSFFGEFSGEDQRRDIDAGTRAVGAGRDAAIGEYRQYGDRARAGLNPYEQGGRRGFDAYARSTGAYGSGAANEAYDEWLRTNPLMAKLRQDQKFALQRSNAGGNGPTTAVGNLSAQRVAMQNWQQGYQNPLWQLGQAGQQAAAQQGAFDMQTAGNIGGAYGSANNALAQLAIQRSQAHPLLPNIIGGVSAAGSLASGLGAYGRGFGFGNNLSGRVGSGASGSSANSGGYGGYGSSSGGYYGGGYDDGNDPGYDY